MSVATALDTETTSFYSLEITATDRHSTHPLSSTAKVSVTVTGKLVKKKFDETKRQKFKSSSCFLILWKWCYDLGSCLITLNDLWFYFGKFEQLFYRLGKITMPNPPTVSAIKVIKCYSRQIRK